MTVFQTQRRQLGESREENHSLVGDALAAAEIDFGQLGRSAYFLKLRVCKLGPCLGQNIECFSNGDGFVCVLTCLLYTSPSPRD